MVKWYIMTSYQFTVICSMFTYTLAIKSGKTYPYTHSVCVPLLTVAHLLLWTMYQPPTTSSITEKGPPLTSNYLNNTSFSAHQWHMVVCVTLICVHQVLHCCWSFFLPGGTVGEPSRDYSSSFLFHAQCVWNHLLAIYQGQLVTTAVLLDGYFAT